MRIEVNVRVNLDRVNIQIPQAEMLQEIPNIVAYDLASQKIVAIGKTSESMEKQGSVKWEQMKSKIGFAPAFDIQSFNAKFASGAIELHTSMAHAKIRPGVQFLIQFLDRIDCSLWFSKYDSLPYDIRKAFEFSIQQAVGLNTLSVNGQAVGWPKWQRKTADWSLRLINLALIVGVFLYGYLRLIRYSFKLLPPEFTGPITTWQTVVFAIISWCMTIAVGLALFYFVVFLGAILWMTIVGRFLPKSLLRAMLPYYQEKYSLKILTPIASVLLSESDRSFV